MFGPDEVLKIKVQNTDDLPNVELAGAIVTSL